jgi:hypothetical protein
MALSGTEPLGFVSLFSVIFPRFFEIFFADLLSEGPFRAAGSSVER